MRFGPSQLSCLSSSVGRALCLEYRVSWVPSPTRGSSFFLGKVTALGVLCCFALFVCLTLLASFFLPSHLSFKNMYMYMYMYTCKFTMNSIGLYFMPMQCLMSQQGLETWTLEHILHCLLCPCHITASLLYRYMYTAQCLSHHACTLHNVYLILYMCMYM